VADIERILQSTPGTLSQQWYEDGAAVNPGTVTVGITRADGTDLVASGAGTTGSGSSARTYSLTTTHTALLDSLTVTWTSTLKGTLVSRVEVVGGFLFSISDARAIAPLNNAVTYSTESIADMRTTVETAIENACGVAFVPRYTHETVSGNGSREIMLRPVPRVIRSVTADGSAFSAGDLALISMGITGSMYSSGQSWAAGTNNVVVGYEHGYGVVPPEVKRAALILAKMWLVGQRSPIDDRAATFNATEGGTYSLVVPGRNGSYFGQPDVDAVIDRYSLKTGLA
jgi:hypothetical protein